MVALIALPLTFTAMCSPPKPGTTTTTNVEATNACTVVGDGNTTYCVGTDSDQSIAGVTFQPLGTRGRWYFDGPKSELPEPPRYGTEDLWNHCGPWTKWMSERNDLYALSDYRVMMRAVSGEGEQVEITGIDVKILNTRKMRRQPTLITCAHGGNGVFGYNAVHDLMTRRTTLTYAEYGGAASEPVSMPPASITLTDNEYESTVVSTRGRELSLYSGFVIVDAIVNGDQTQFQYGSREQPLRWGAAPELASGDTNVPVLDWDRNLGAWTDASQVLAGG